MPSLNLYAIGAALLVILGLTTWGFWEKATIADYKTQIEKMNGEMAAAKAAHDIAVSNLNTTLEKTHADHQSALDTAGNRIAGLAADLDRVRSQPGASCGDKVRTAAQPKASAPGKPGVDSGSFSELAGIASRCVALAEYARMSHDWAAGLEAVQ